MEGEHEYASSRGRRAVGLCAALGPSTRISASFEMAAGAALRAKAISSAGLADRYCAIGAILVIAARRQAPQQPVVVPAVPAPQAGAAECHAAAQSVHDSAIRQAYLELAQAWQALAEEIERLRSQIWRPQIYSGRALPQRSLDDFY